jgi:hypothetical protein
MEPAWFIHSKRQNTPFYRLKSYISSEFLKFYISISRILCIYMQIEEAEHTLWFLIIISLIMVYAITTNYLAIKNLKNY